MSFYNKIKQFFTNEDTAKGALFGCTIANIVWIIFYIWILK